ncbi:bifunctional 23S rRNA (guanine(2069)-N(7))-methyltransferase RlmK/23S rRNA (guanine(2445)-N(2))-methyltransferase RlmL [Thiotrichales bacterium 19S3-7]|nr:bifunctional 23S rRNA (guanine(2069)-N(7))-methyltransferase RlmK/23S rRNA (guanine(2445)-N(2))-methyltransferase RlmL [Thiotrichales bacterium 19S3-7]MCF6801101.1 bifunctional 23S rRNA (guanine(2069)-N(7))-methyltransferase RlmK/23S rRNA (guanine(2445)-N(2))-methyltransferase RlmL [Thiotrichales bacterium 19S3-11]
MNEYKFFATTAKGIESLLLNELSDLGASDTKETVLGVSFHSSLEVAYRICLWSRLTHQLLMIIKDELEVDSPEAIYQHINQINWLLHIPYDGSFRIDVSGKHPAINNTQFIALKAKDAIVDQIRSIKGIRPSIKTKNPDVVIQLHIAKEKLTVSISLSGESLHKRGYRLDTGSAPLKETLACAILIRSNWPKQVLSDDACLVDPMCGSGTLLIEAAMMAYEIAPGLDRHYYGFSHWLGHDNALWQSLLSQAKEKKKKNLTKIYTEIQGFDINFEQLRICKNNIHRAGLEKVIHVKQQSLDALDAKQLQHTYGLIVTNPPYGQRLLANEDEKLTQLIQCFGERLRASFHNWNVSIFTANPQSIKKIALKPTKRYKLFNGKLESELLNFTVNENSILKTETALEKLERKAEAHFANPSESLAMFMNRLRKNIKHLSRWAKRNQLEAYRLYDQDLPEYAFAIDCYKALVHIQEYQAGKGVDAEKSQRRFYEAIAAVKHTLDIPYEAIFVKIRQKQKGANQYQKLNEKETFSIIKEDKAQFYVNLSDYLDTGIFLDHRLMRLKVAQNAQNKKLLNLFSYTCTASTLAALYGAKEVTSVDLSNTYLNWGKRNFQLNRVDLKKHKFIQADCLKWLEANKEKYDVIFLDPPTFSNSKRMTNTLDIQRDHSVLIKLAMKHLKADGILYFSNNYRKFKLDIQITQAYHCNDISNQCLSEDFKRRPNIHYCFELTHKG